MNFLQVKGLVKKNITNYVKSYQIAYDMVSISFSVAFVSIMAYILGLVQ
jgi:hypothetical protein